MADSVKENKFATKKSMWGEELICWRIVINGKDALFYFESNERPMTLMLFVSFYLFYEYY